MTIMIPTKETVLILLRSPNGSSVVIDPRDIAAIVPRYKEKDKSDFSTIFLRGLSGRVFVDLNPEDVFKAIKEGLEAPQKGGSNE